MVVYFILSCLGINYLVSNVFAWFFSVLFAYVTNRRGVFESKDTNILKECTLFFSGRIFSLFHELTHLILGESAICDVDKNNAKEWLCNSVAAQFLVPQEDLLKNTVVKLNHSGRWTASELVELSNEYGVSRQSLLLRLIHLNKAPQKSYDEMKSQWMGEYKKKSSGGGSPVLNQIKYNGKMYSFLMLAAYENGVISSVDFSQDMGLRIKHVDELSEKLFG